MPVVCCVVLEKEKLVATLVVVVDIDVVVVDVVVLGVKVVIVLWRVTARKLDAKSRPSPAGQTFATGATAQAWIVIK
jgi:hypothetical protein